MLFIRVLTLLVLLLSSLGCAAVERASDIAEPVIIDSDGAVFWDDGAAIAMLLQHPEKVKILGITTVVGNQWPYQAAEYINRILKIANRTDIPIYIGADKPLENSKQRIKQIEEDLARRGLVPKVGFWKGAFSRPKEIHNLDDVEPVKGEALSGLRPQSKSAVDFIIDTVSSSRKPVTLVAIGPLTNVAQALQRRPDLAVKIRRILIMGGNIDVPGNTTPKAELNFLFDPEAVGVVWSSGIREKILFPLDFTQQAVLSRDTFLDLVRVKAPYMTLLEADRGPKFADPTYTVQSWDTAVSAFLIEPSYVNSSEIMKLNISTKVGENYGSVRVDEKSGFAIKVMKSLDFSSYLSILKASLGVPPYSRSRD